MQAYRNDGFATCASKQGFKAILDSCVWVYLLQGRLATDFVDAMRNSGLIALVEANILHEVARVLNLSEDVTFERMKGSGLNTRTCVAERHDKIESWQLVALYDMCHYPDSLYLAMCKNNGWTLFTCDRDLLSCARLESVAFRNPVNAHLGAVVH
jgi:predicted nucleic acid-binding protein